MRCCLMLPHVQEEDEGLLEQVLAPKELAALRGGDKGVPLHVAEGTESRVSLVALPSVS